MSVTCPDCATHYAVPPQISLDTGRYVKCRKCHRVWFATSADLAGGEAASAGIDEDGLRDDAILKDDAITSGSSDILRLADGVDSKWSADIFTQAIPQDAIRSTWDNAVAVGEANESARSVKRSAALSVIRTVALCLFVMVGLAVGLLSTRHAVVSVLPGTARLYAAVGYPVNLRGLAFRNIVFERDVEGGIPVLLVRGEVVNITQSPQVVPRIRLALRDRHDVEIYRWTASVSEQRIQPSGHVPFSTRLITPPDAAASLEVRFVSRMDSRRPELQ